MICQIKPRIRISLPSTKSCEPILTTEQPIAFADWITMLLFSVAWNAFNVGCLTLGLFNTRSSIVSGTASLINFERMRPSLVSSNIWKLSVGKGNLPPTSLSPSKTYCYD